MSGAPTFFSALTSMNLEGLFFIAMAKLAMLALSYQTATSDHVMIATQQ